MTNDPSLADPLDDVAIILCENDLEAHEILRLAKGRAQCVVLQGAWGMRPPLDDPRLQAQALPSSVILCELPDPALEDALRAAGKRVYCVDHHLSLTADGKILDRRCDRTALEQVATLLGVSLDDEQRAIAMNDGGFWPALIRYYRGQDRYEKKDGINEAGLDAVRAIRTRDLTAQGRTSDAVKTASGWLTDAFKAGHARTFTTTAKADAQDLILIHCPPEHAPAIGDALYEWALDDDHWAGSTRKGDPLPMMSVVPDSDSSSIALAGIDGLATFVHLFARWARDAGLKCWAGGDGRAAYFGTIGDADAIDALADRILSELLTGASPVRAWRTQFYQALSPHSGHRPRRPVEGTTTPLVADPQERAYFNEYLRDLITPTTAAIKAGLTGRRCGDDALILGSWSVPVSGLTIRVDWPNKEGATRTLIEPVIEATVHFAPEGVMFLEWVVGNLPDQPTAPETTLPLWKSLLTQPTRDGVATAADALDFTNAARNCFSPFTNDNERVDITLQRDGAAIAALTYGQQSEGDTGTPREWFGALAQIMLDPFGLSEENTTLLFDERARIVSTLVLQGEGPKSSEGAARHEPLRARFSSVEPYDSSHFYTRDFAVAEMERGLYDRFSSSGSLIFASSHSLSLLGYGWFPAAYGMQHMATQYRRMFIVMLMYAAVFQRLWRGLVDSGAPGLDQQGRADAVRAVRHRMTRFANVMWFDTLTPQIQGRELFDLMRKLIPVRTEYDELTAQLERLDALVDAERAQADDTRRDNMTASGFAIAGGVAAHQLLLPLYTGIDSSSREPIVVSIAIAGVILLAIMAITVHRKN